jgi:hypothetical protein
MAEKRRDLTVHVKVGGGTVLIGEGRMTVPSAW